MTPQGRVGGERGATEHVFHRTPAIGSHLYSYRTAPEYARLKCFLVGGGIGWLLRVRVLPIGALAVCVFYLRGLATAEPRTWHDQTMEEVIARHDKDI